MHTWNLLAFYLVNGLTGFFIYFSNMRRDLLLEILQYTPDSYLLYLQHNYLVNDQTGFLLDFLTRSFEQLRYRLFILFCFLSNITFKSHNEHLPPTCFTWLMVKQDSCFSFPALRFEQLGFRLFIFYFFLFNKKFKAITSPASYLFYPQYEYLVNVHTAFLLYISNMTLWATWVQIIYTFFFLFNMTFKSYDKHLPPTCFTFNMATWLTVEQASCFIFPTWRFEQLGYGLFIHNFFSNKTFKVIMSPSSYLLCLQYGCVGSG